MNRGCLKAAPCHCYPLTIQVVDTFSELTHVQNHVGILFTRSLRMVRHTGSVVQLLPGKLDRIISKPGEIQQFAKADHQPAHLFKTQIVRELPNNIYYSTVG